MADYSGLANAVFASAGANVVRSMTPSRRVMFEWRTAEEIEAERIKLSGFLAGREISDAQVAAIRADVDRFLMDAAMAMMRR